MLSPCISEQAQRLTRHLEEASGIIGAEQRHGASLRDSFGREDGEEMDSEIFQGKGIDFGPSMHLATL